MLRDPHVGVEHQVGAQEALADLQVPVEGVVEAHRRGVEEGEGVGVRAAGVVQLRSETGVHGRIAADPHRQQLRLVFCLCPGPAAPWAMACQCRAKIGGAADPATSSLSAPVVATSPILPATMHGVA